MKKIVLITISVLSVLNALTQNSYTLNGSTNYTNDGVAVLRYTTYYEFYTNKIPHDTAIIRQGKFVFSGVQYWPEQYRISIIYNDNVSHISEPFFIDKGVQSIAVDSNMALQVPFDFGGGILVTNSKAYDGYIHEFLPVFDSLTKRILVYYDHVRDCQQKTDEAAKQKCAL